MCGIFQQLLLRRNRAQKAAVPPKAPSYHVDKVNPSATVRESRLKEENQLLQVDASLPQGENNKLPAGILLKEIPIPDNAFATGLTGCNNPNSDAEAECKTDPKKWSSPENIWTTHFKVDLPDTITVSLRLRLPPNEQSSFKYSLGLEDTEHVTNVEGSNGDQIIFLGSRAIEEGRDVAVKFQGLTRSGETYADVIHLQVTYLLPENNIRASLDQDPSEGLLSPSLQVVNTLSPELQAQVEEARTEDNRDENALTE